MVSSKAHHTGVAVALPVMQRSKSLCQCCSFGTNLILHSLRFLNLLLDLMPKAEKILAAASVPWALAQMAHAILRREWRVADRADLKRKCAQPVMNRLRFVKSPEPLVQCKEELLAILDIDTCLPYPVFRSANLLIQRGKLLRELLATACDGFLPRPLCVSARIRARYMPSHARYSSSPFLALAIRCWEPPGRPRAKVSFSIRSEGPIFLRASQPAATRPCRARHHRYRIEDPPQPPGLEPCRIGRL